MDNLTHALSGLVLNGLLNRPVSDSANAEPKVAKARLITIFTASQLPDLDVVARLQGELSYLNYHRGPTHSIVGVLALSLLLTGVIKLFFPSVKTYSLFFWGLLAGMLHVTLDLLTAYGTQVFYPWDLTRYAWDSLMIIDAFLLLLMISGLIGARLLRHRISSSRVLSFIALAAVIYIGGRVGIHGYLSYQVMDYMSQQQNISCCRASVLPPLLGIREWDLVIETPQEFLLGTAALDEEPRIVKRIKKEETGPVVRSALETGPARVFLSFARYPYIVNSETEEGYQILIVDLRYYMNGRIPFSLQLDLNRDLRLVDYAMGRQTQASLL